MSDLSYGDGSYTNPSRGEVGFSFGPFSFGMDQTGVWSGGVDGSLGPFSVGLDSYGWSIPVGPATIGETWKEDGRYGSFTIGGKSFGLYFDVHQDNPTTNMEALGSRQYELKDDDGNLIGYERYQPVGNSTVGWSWQISRVDVYGKPLGPTKSVPMDAQTAKQLASGFVDDECFPAHTPITISLSETRPISDIRVGDTVLAFDPAADLGRGALVPRKVVRLYRNSTEEWVKLTWTEGGEAKELVATPGHHFLDRFGNFPTIEEMLENGKATVILASGETAEVIAERITYNAQTAHLFEQAQAVGMIAGNAALKPAASGAVYTRYL